MCRGDDGLQSLDLLVLTRFLLGTPAFDTSLLVLDSDLELDLGSFDLGFDSLFSSMEWFHCFQCPSGFSQSFALTLLVLGFDLRCLHSDFASSFCRYTVPLGAGTPHLLAGTINFAGRDIFSGSARFKAA